MEEQLIEQAAPPRIGYIGLGVMGRGMVANILKQYPVVTVWNRTPERTEPLVALGAVPAVTPAELAAQSDIVCICVSDTPDVEQVIFGPRGVVETIPPETLLIDFSTICPDRTVQLAGRLRATTGAPWVDAPVSGGDVGARNGTLTVMAGGLPEDFARALPLLESVGKKIVHMGPVGAGQRTKLCNQIAVMGTIVSMAEAMNFARESGMDVARVIEVVGSGAAGSWSLNNYGPRILRGDFAPGFALSLMAKDLRIVLRNLEDKKADYSTVKRMAELCEQMLADGNGHEGLHALVKALGWQQD